MFRPRRLKQNGIAAPAGRISKLLKSLGKIQVFGIGTRLAKDRASGSRTDPNQETIHED
jgi:hypothetical protein